MLLDTPMRYVYDLWTDLLYGDQPAGWDVIGTEEVIKKAKKEQFIKYLKEHYSSKNTIIAIAGNIDYKKLLIKLKNILNLLIVI